MDAVDIRTLSRLAFAMEKLSKLLQIHLKISNEELEHEMRK